MKRGVMNVCVVARLQFSTHDPQPAACDFGGKGVKKGEPRGHIFVSDDQGATWRQTGCFPMCHARPFLAGGRLYILGHYGDLGVTVSDDGGLTWSETRNSTDGQSWHQSACNVWYANGNVYLVMERSVKSGAATGTSRVAALRLDGGRR